MQINQGSLSTQSFKQGHYCNGPIVSFAPYVLQTEAPQSLTRNFGGQLSLSVPLDGGSVELCKSLAKVALQKQRLDYELVRIKECINIFKAGFQIRKESPFNQICSDVVPIASLTRKEALVSPEPLLPSLVETLSPVSILE